jgi:hypothetical protein
MSRDSLAASLLAFAQGTSLSEDDLVRMVQDEMARLSSEARIHDYIQVLAVKSVRDRMRLEVRARHAGNGWHTKEG